MEKVEKSQLVMKQFFVAMTINIAGLSAHSCIVLDKYKNDNNIKIIRSVNVMENFKVLVTTISYPRPFKQTWLLFAHTKTIKFL